MSLATADVLKSGGDSADLIVRLMLRHDEVFRLPAASRGLQVVSGLAWLTVAGEDIFLGNGQRLWLAGAKGPALLSALGQTPLIVEVLGDSASASPGMESMLKNLVPTQGCVC
ncbi:MAG: DUF2917 domain-containing protein [Anaerolineae bacterium]|nr:DUF2917 domain-containing protein [Anaerolineae bacterium]